MYECSIHAHCFGKTLLSLLPFWKIKECEKWKLFKNILKQAITLSVRYEISTIIKTIGKKLTNAVVLSAKLTKSKAPNGGHLKISFSIEVSENYFNKIAKWEELGTKRYSMNTSK